MTVATHVIRSQATLRPSWYGVVGDGVTNDTTALQAALDAAEGRELEIPAGTYLSGPLTLPDNVKLTLLPGVILTSNTTLLTGTTKLLNITGENCHIVAYGAKIDMAAGFASEYNHGVNIEGATGRVVIEGLASNDTGGDGFYVKSPLADVELRGCSADNNRRQGLSIIEAKSFSDFCGSYNGSTGAAPSCGVDVEPNDPGDVLGPVRFYGTRTAGNDASGFLVFLYNWNKTTNVADIEFHDCSSVGDAVSTSSSLNRQGSFEIRRIAGSRLTTGSVVSGDATLTVASGRLHAEHVGKSITVAGAGVAGADLVTTIASVTSANVLELTVAASTTVSSVTVTYADTPASGKIRIVGCRSMDAGYAGFRAYNKDVSGARVEIIDPYVRNANTHNSGTAYEDGGIIAYSDANYGTTPGGVLVQRPTVDQPSGGYMTYAVYVASTGGGHANCDIIDPQPIGTFSATSAVTVGAEETTVRVRYADRQYVARTTGLTLTDGRYLGKILTNEGAAGTIALTLIGATAARIGWRFSFQVRAAQQIDVTPGAGDQIYPIGTGAADPVSSSTVGSLLTVECVAANQWMIVEQSGTWA